MKVCSKCHIEKEDDCFWKAKNSTGLSSYCKECSKEKSTEWRRMKGVPEKAKPQKIGELQKQKVCNRCKVEKKRNEFSIHKTQYKGEIYLHIKSNCRKCQNELAKIRYDKQKDNPEFKEKNRQRVKAYVKKNVNELKHRRKLPHYIKKHNAAELARYYRMSDVIKAKNKIKRQTPAYKKMMREYREKNKEKIAKQEIITKKRYQEKNSKPITDKYVTKLFVQQGKGTKEQIQANKELIELKRTKVLIHRIKKEIKQKRKK